MKTNMATSKFIISGGGTGGHIYPALTIADIIVSLGATPKNIYYIGNKNRQEGDIDMPYNFIHVPTVGMPRKIGVSFIKFVFLLFISIAKTVKLYIAKKPVMAIGTGGFVTFPALWPARFFKTKTVIHEQNSHPGIVNKLLAKQAEIIFTGFPKFGSTFPTSKVIVSGNPVREAIITKDSYIEKIFTQYGIDYKIEVAKEKIKEHFNQIILIFGGSTGAKKINELFSGYCEKERELIESSKVMYVWITGKGLYDTYKNNKTKNVHILPYCTDMHTLYGIVDFAVARSGAMTISELINYKIPGLLVPFPFASEDHQYHNALVLKETGCADVIREEELNSEIFSKYLIKTTSSNNNISFKKENYSNFSGKNPNEIIKSEIKKILKNSGVDIKDDC